MDTHKTGIQRTLQGFETADTMARRIAINLTSSGDTYEIPFDHVSALMYITTPGATEPSINECVIEDNTIICDLEAIRVQGITDMRLKLIHSCLDGARMVLATPRFALEVTDSGISDENATHTITFTSMENAIARAKEVYDARLLRIEIDGDCMFRAYFADGTTYESDVLREVVYKANYLMAQSYAVGGTGVRNGEETDNAKYYSQVSKSESLSAKQSSDVAIEMANEARKHSNYTVFEVDFENGELQYLSAKYEFDINAENGQLETKMNEHFDIADIDGEAVLVFTYNEETEEMTINTVAMDKGDEEKLQTQIDELKEELIEIKYNKNCSLCGTTFRADQGGYLGDDGTAICDDCLDTRYCDNCGMLLRDAVNTGAKPTYDMGWLDCNYVPKCDVCGTTEEIEIQEQGHALCKVHFESMTCANCGTLLTDAMDSGRRVGYDDAMGGWTCCY